MDLIKGVSQSMQATEAKNTFEEFSQLEMALVKIKQQVRERIQSLTAGDIKAIIGKLESSQPLSAAEQNYVRMWLVGDAEGYLRMENNLKDWLKEFKRLLGALADFEKKEESIPGLVNLHGLLEDAVRVTGSLAHFLEDKERIARFEKAIKSLDSADSKLIAQILQSKLASPEM
jgi:hypothetical protein